MNKPLLVLVGTGVLVAYIASQGSKESRPITIDVSDGEGRSRMAAPVSTEMLLESYGRFSEEVDRYLDQFLAAVDQAIVSWIELGEVLPLDRQTVFGRVVRNVRAITTIESGGDPSAVSKTGRLGLMQLTPRVGLFLNEGETPEILFDPHYNIFRGTWYYFVLWVQSYEELGFPTDLSMVDRLAAARYYRGGHNVSATGVWDDDIRGYVRKFEAAIVNATR